MRNRRSGWPQPSSFEDPDVDRKARILRRLMVMGAAFAVVGAFTSTSQQLAILLSAMPQVVAYGLLVTGRYRPAVWLILINGYVTILYLAVTHPLGLYSEMPLSVLMLMALGAALLGRPGVYLVAVMGLVLLIVTASTGRSAIEASEALSSPNVRLATLAGMVLLSGFLQIGVLSSLDLTTKRLRAEIDERRKAEAALEIARDDALHSAQAKTQFLANMSHEIRTPMNAIVSISRMMAAGNLPEDQRENAEIVCRSSESLLKIINDILDFSRVESGRLEIAERPVAIRSLLDNISGLLKSAAVSKGVTLSFACRSDVPEIVMTDPIRLEQVLINLVGNALKFTDSGTVSTMVSLAPDDRRGSLAFSVADTGIGIPPLSLERIFDPFTQVDGSMTRQHAGSGLGLSISKSLVELMGGEIWATSLEGRGSTFVFTINARSLEGDEIAGGPVGIGVALSPSAPSYPSPPPWSALTGPPVPPVSIAGDRVADSPRWPTPSMHSSLRVLVAEDNAVNRLVIIKMLAAEGIDPIVVENGAEAVAAALSEPYDLILMDIQMPVLDGIEAARQIRGGAPVQPMMVALTAHALVGDRERFLAEGLDGYLSKPVAVAELRAVVAQAAERRAGSA